MAVWTAYDLGGADAAGDNIKEDVSQIISNIAPTQTPFQSMARKGKAKGVFSEWLVDDLADAAQNINIEGADADDNTLVKATRRGNYCQILDKTAKVSGTVDNGIDLHGRTGGDMAYQMAKKMKELKRDREFTVVGANTAWEAGDAADAREMASVHAFIFTNDDSQASATTNPNPVGSDTRTDSGTTRAFTESQLQNIAEDVWNEGGEADVLMLGSARKRDFSGFDGVATKFKDAEDKRTIGATDVYISDWGEIRAVPNRFMRAKDVFLFDMSTWELRWLRPTFVQDLAITGDFTRKQVVEELTLAALNEKGSGAIYDLA